MFLLILPLSLTKSYFLCLFIIFYKKNNIYRTGVVYLGGIAILPERG